MNVCPICQWPLNGLRQLQIHMEIKHPPQTDMFDDDDILNDDGVYIGDEVVHHPYDDEEDWLEEYDYTEGDIGQDGGLTKG